jgi:hypothetical protein
MLWNPELAIAIAKASWDHLADGPWMPGWISKLLPNLFFFLMRPARGPQTKLKGNPDQHAIGSWAMYLSLGTQAEADDKQS